MSWSAAELLALATKAARGGGAPAGQAARFGQAAVVHLLAGRAAEDLGAALDALPEGPILTYPLQLDAALAEARRGVAEICCADDDGLFHSYVDALPFLSERAEKAEMTCFRISLETPAARGGTQRVTGCDPLVERMRRLAQAVLVPESDASRAAGAGAGLTDND